MILHFKNGPPLLLSLLFFGVTFLKACLKGQTSLKQTKENHFLVNGDMADKRQPSYLISWVFLPPLWLLIQLEESMRSSPDFCVIFYKTQQNNMTM